MVDLDLLDAWTADLLVWGVGIRVLSCVSYLLFDFGRYCDCCGGLFVDD